MTRMRYSSGRTAFTVIEMMVVVAIIAILAALVAAGTIQFISAQQSSNTENALRTLDRVLQDKWTKVISDARKETPSDRVQILASGDNDPGHERAKILWIKLRLMEAFPQKFSEIFDSAGTFAKLIPPKQSNYRESYRNALKGWNMAKHKPATESAACLMLALSINPGGRTISMDDLAENFADTDEDGIKELVDSWGKPMRFVRFPASLAEVDSLNPAKTAMFRDPLDSKGLLQRTTGATAWNGKSAFESLFGTEVTANKYMVPVIASSGRNGMPGDNDDIYSFRLRIGARGD